MDPIGACRLPFSISNITINMKNILTALSALLICHGAMAALSVNIGWNSPALCTYPTGSVYANPNGGLPPYTYLWNTGETTSTIQNLPAGVYSVTVTDDEGTQASAQITLDSQNLTAGVAGYYLCPNESFGDPFRMLGMVFSVPGVGILPITMDGSGYVVDILSNGEPGGSVYYLAATGAWPAPGTYLQLPFTNSDGCPGTMDVNIPRPFTYTIPQVLTVHGACSGGSNGGVLVHVPAVAYASPNYIQLFRNGVLQGNLYDQGGYGQQFGQLPQTIERNDLAPGDYALVASPRFPDPFEWLIDAYFYEPCGDTTFFTVPDLGYTCGTLTGTAYMDDNFNCIPQYNEVRVPATVMEIQPGGYFTMTNASGAYHQNVPYGSYTVQQQSAAVSEHCAGVPQAFDLSAQSLNATRNFPDTTLLPRDVELSLSSSFARPGFQMSYGIEVEHRTAGVTGAMTITMEFDPVLSFVSASPAPSSIVGNTITWNLPQLTSFGWRSWLTYFEVPPDVNLIGTDLITTATVGIAQPEPDPTNNSVTNTRTITGAYDPNVKEVSTSSGWSNELYYIDQDEWLDYTIHFQNTGTDTAFFVVITDTLPETLDPASFQMGARSHLGTVEMGGHGILRFIFPNILLPDSNVNEAKSHGFVSFRIKPRLPVMPGTVIENIANIYFDYNPPVITEPSVLIATLGTGMQEQQLGQSLWLMPNPTSGSLEVRVSNISASGMLQVISMDGRVLLQQSMEGPRTVLDVAHLSRGMYLLNWLDADGIVSTQRFVRE